VGSVLSAFSAELAHLHLDLVSPFLSGLIVIILTLTDGTS
jgi:hypothetical protein